MTIVAEKVSYNVSSLYFITDYENVGGGCYKNIKYVKFYLFDDKTKLNHQVVHDRSECGMMTSCLWLKIFYRCRLTIFPLIVFLGTDVDEFYMLAYLFIFISSTNII